MSDIVPRVHFFHPAGLDPVTVYVEEIRPGSSRIIVHCWAQAWTAYLGAHGDVTVERFIVGCNPEYIADSLLWGDVGYLRKDGHKRLNAYVVRIAKAMKEHFAGIEAAKGGAA